MSATYAIMAIIAAILLIGYCVIARKKEMWLLMLSICITVVNTGYFLLSIAQTLTFAIIANDIAYFGSVFLSMCMFLTIVKLCGFEIKRGLVISLLALALAMFAVIATSSILPLYYKELSLVSVGGASKLVKVYGPLHKTYLVYLLGYFAAMIIIITVSMRRKILASQKRAAFVAAVVFGNIAIWLVEKFIPWDFEFLSVSYLFSELVFLGLHWMMQDYVRADLVSAAGVALPNKEEQRDELKLLTEPLKGSKRLTTREYDILALILQNKRRKEIAEQLCLSENTVKTYTRTLYSKLGVSSREEIYTLLNRQ